jgi:hypothetical protein
MPEKMKISGFANAPLGGEEHDTKQKESFFKTSMSGSSNSQFSNSEKNKFKKFPLWIMICAFGLFVCTLAYVFAFSKNSILSPIPGSSDLKANTDNKNNNESLKLFENPLNGMFFPEEEAQKFKNKKPIAVMVNNYDVARPSAGLSQADVVYEVVAEAGITRIMPIFLSRIPESVSSIRSARYYFVELASAYHAHYIHWGAAHVPPCQKLVPGAPGSCSTGGKVETNPKVDAYDRIVQLGLPNLDGGNYSCDEATCAFGRDPKKLGKVPLEHTAFVRLPLIYDLAKKIRPQEAWHKFTPLQDQWTFKDEEEKSNRGQIGVKDPITYKYWDTQPGFDVKWVYDRDKNEYIRYQGGIKQTDANNGQELRAKVVIVRLTVETPVGDKKNHLYQGIVGKGKLLLFQDGKVVEGTWERKTEEALDIFKDTKGEIIKLNRGQIWVQLVPSENKINYSSVEPAVQTVSPTPKKTN